MRTRFAVATVAVMLAVAPACRSAKDNNLPGAIRNVPGMVESVRDVMGDPVQKPVEKVPPKPDVVEAHRAEVLKTTPQPVKGSETETVVPVKPVFTDKPIKRAPKIQ